MPPWDRAVGAGLVRIGRRLSEIKLPEAELPLSERFLAFLRAQADPVRATLDVAPIADETETDEGRQAAAEAKCPVQQSHAVTEQLSGAALKLWA